MKSVFSGLLLFVQLFSFSQKVEKENALFTIRGSANIPRTVSSMMFRHSFSGIYQVNLSANYKMAGNFFVGLGYQNALFRNHKAFIVYQAPNGAIPYQTQMVQNAAFLNLGFDQYFSKTGYMSYSLNSGMMFCHYTDVVPDTSLANRPYGAVRFATPYVQPEMGVNFIIDENETMTLNILLSYTTMFSQFDPRAPRFNQMAAVYIKRNNYFMSWMSIGLGFHVLIGKAADKG
jgi:hypothetical protein